MRPASFLLICTIIIASCGKPTTDNQAPATYIDMKFTNDTSNLLDPFYIPTGAAILSEDNQGFQIALQYFPLDIATTEDPVYNVNIHFYLTHSEVGILQFPDQEESVLLFCNETHSNVYVTYYRPQQETLLFEGETISTQIEIHTIQIGGSILTELQHVSGTITGSLISEDGSVSFEIEASFNYRAS